MIPRFTSHCFSNERESLVETTIVVLSLSASITVNPITTDLSENEENISYFPEVTSVFIKLYMRNYKVIAPSLAIDRLLFYNLYFLS